MSLDGRLVYHDSLSNKENELNWFILFQVGKFYGESIYKTVDDTEFINPSMQEFYAHSKYWDYYKRAHENLFAI